MKLKQVILGSLVALGATGVLRADNARFDLAGPKVDVKVTRGGVTLPIAEVPNLQPGDKIWVKADLPSTQSNHLLLIIAFLRGTTNEPPDKWFTEVDTWDKKTVEGTTVEVPEGAEQALMFIAPETGGDFKTLRSAVKGRPGLFIRADTDLNEASFEQQRIERYLAEMKNVSQDDPKAIQDHSAKLAATLALKPNADCFKQPVDQQVNCLTQSSAPVLLDDGHGESIADALSTGASSDFINAASYTQAAGAGVYSAYVGAVVDLVHLVSLLHTAKYQYIPGLSFPQQSTLNLKLNAPPSFINPKSVIVIGLPAIQKAKLPPLRPQNANQISCLLQPKLILPLEGAPLVFSTSFAHDLKLHLNRTGAPEDIPLAPEPFEGGLVRAAEEVRQPLQDESADTDTTGAKKPEVKLGSSHDLYVTGTIHGYWGFDPFDRPTLTLQQVDGKDWKVVGDTQLLAGQEDHLTLKGDGTACVQKIVLTTGKDQDTNVNFKPAEPEKGKAEKDTLALDVSMKEVRPGGYSLDIRQYGDANEDKVPLIAYSGDIHLDAVRLHEGDDRAVLTGKGLTNVASVKIAGQTFTPSGTGDSDDLLHLVSKNGVSPKDDTEAAVQLKDGRTMDVKVSTEAPRPGLMLMSFHTTPATKDGALAVHLGGKNEIPLDGKLTFVVQTKEPFPRNQTLEIGNADGSLHTTLSLAENNLVLQDEHTAIGTLNPQKAFGDSAFGQLQMRPVAADGTPGDWTPLGVLVRTPQITAVHCDSASAQTCMVDGQQLFLVQAFGAEKDFAKPVDVPSGFADNSFAVPVPADGDTLYMKLRDDPEQIASVTLPTPLPKAPPAPVANTPGTQTSPASPVAATSTSGASPASPVSPPSTTPLPAEAATPTNPNQPSESGATKPPAGVGAPGQATPAQTVTGNSTATPAAASHGGAQPQAPGEGTDTAPTPPSPQPQQ